MSSTAADGLALERVFPGKSAMAAHLRVFDWSTTDLGAPPTWPSTLRVALGICLTAQLPMQIWWGPARTFFYNDACLPLFGAPHQDALALDSAAGEAWPRLVTQISSEIEQVFTTGAANGPVASRLNFDEDHSPRERDVTFSFSPLLGESGAVEGVFGVCSVPPALPALRASEEKYRTLFDSIDEGVCLFERQPLRSDGRRDYCYIAMNPAMQAMFGIPDLSGQSIRDNFPDEVEDWYDDYDRVLETGEALRFERASEPQGMVLEMFVTRVEDGSGRTLLAVMQDVTARKQQEQRQEFLLKLNDTLRFQSDAVEIQAATTESVLHHFGADRCYYCEIQDDKAIIRRDAARANLPPVAGIYPLKDFPLFKAMMNGGVPLVVQDARVTDAMDEALKQLCVQMKIISFINIPVVKNNRYTGNLCITRSAPGDWTNFEVKLAEEIAERTWAAVERAKAEAALRASEARIRITVEAAQMATWDWTISTGEVFWNEQHFLLFGMAPQDRSMTSADFFNHVHPDDRPWLGATLQAAIDQRRVFQAEFRSLNEDGSKRWMSGYGRVVAEADGQAMRMSGVMFDITERKEAEEALRESETRQAIILETMAEGVVTIDCDGRFFSANAAAERILGVARSELIGQSIYTPPYQRFDLDGAPWGDHLLLAEIVAAGPRIFHHDYVIERRDGSRVVVSRNITAMFTTAGLILGFVSTLSDITEQKRTETALRDSEARFRAVANLVPDLLWSNDATDVIDWYNQRWLEYTGQTLENAAAYGWLNAVHPDDRAIALDNFQQALEQGEPFRQEQRLANARGEYRWFLVQAIPLKDANGKILRWFGAATDIHEQWIVRETLEQRVQERTHELEALSVSRQQLLDRILKVQEDERRRIAHELHDTLGQFLSALNLRLSLLQQSVQPHDESAWPIVEELGQLWQLVNEIDSELRRLTMELRPPILDDLGLDEAIRRYAEAWSQTTAIPVDVYTAGFAGERLAHTIELPIYRIVQEALTNVLKHAQASSVSVILERRFKELQLIIEDNGVGFDPNAVDSQEEGRRSLGLIGMQERAALVGGWVDLETAPGAGTTVYVHIPLHTEKSDLSQDFPHPPNRPS